MMPSSHVENVSSWPISAVIYVFVCVFCLKVRTCLVFLQRMLAMQTEKLLKLQDVIQLSSKSDDQHFLHKGVQSMREDIGNLKARVERFEENRTSRTQDENFGELNCPRGQLRSWGDREANFHFFINVSLDQLSRSTNR